MLQALSCDRTRFSGVLLDKVDKFPIVHKKEIEEAAMKAGIRLGDSSSHKDAFAVTFVNGLCNAEEALLSLFYAVIKNDKFMIAGGSAGDNLCFKTTYVSLNGKTVSDGAAILFVKTSLPFFILKENIFKSTGRKFRITDADPKKRKILRLNGMIPKECYIQALGCSEKEANEAILSHPFGRVFGGQMFISSIASFNLDGTMNMYSRVLPNATVELMELVDIEENIKESLETIKAKIAQPKCVILINCILRTLIFKKLNLFGKVLRLYDDYGIKVAGFSSYGEQVGRINSNQTALYISIGG